MLSLVFSHSFQKPIFGANFLYSCPLYQFGHLAAIEIGIILFGKFFILA